jgi:sialate O-acetylesterase
LNVTKRTASEPRDDVDAKWLISSPESTKNFSAVAYFFAKEIRENQKCPVAVLQAPWGGTSIETWISLDGLSQNPPITKKLEMWSKAVEQYKKIKANPQPVADYEADLKKWKLEVEPEYNAAMKVYNQAIAEGKLVGKRPQPARPEPSNPDPMGMPSPSRRPSTPTVNFNGMIAPLIPFAIRGVIWYQGENDGNAGYEYRLLMPRLIEDWRRKWQQPGTAKDFPFLYVQLPSNGADTTHVAEKGWPFLREAQLMSLRVPNTGMAITIDVGDPKNVHPADKFNVGHRLALVARKQVYGEKIVASGPLYRDFVTKQNGAIQIRFNETGSGLMIGQSPWYAPTVAPFPKDKLIGFFIAGEDKKWVEADAQIDGETVLVSSPRVPKPAAVRYGWANSPRCNLYNKEGLPASPFRTDVD